MSETPDILTRFSFTESPIRGAIVNLHGTWQSLAARDEYPACVSALLGQSAAASALFTSQIKLSGSLALQIQGRGALPLLYAQCTSDGAVRGLARYASDIAPDFAMPDLPEDTTLAITIDQQGSQRYQGIVPLVGEQLSEAYEAYFARSEQIKTRIWLATSETAAAGLMIQRMPGAPDEADYWDHISHLAATITDPELLDLGHESILRRLFHQESVQLLETRSLRFECPCSRDRVARVLLALGKQEVLASRQEHGKVEVQCEFCNENYGFDVVDIEALFAEQPVVDAGDTRQ